MMTYLRATALCASFITAFPAAAQQFAGGQADLTYRGYSDVDTDALSGRVSGEFALSRSFSLQGDLFVGRLNGATGGDATSYGATLHGLYHVSGTSTVGAFATYEDFDGFDGIGSVGVEAGATFGTVAAEVWLGLSEDESGTDGNFFGLETRRGLGPVYVFGSVEYYNLSGDLESVQSGIGVEYKGANGLGLTAKYESLYFEDDGRLGGDTSSISVGATYRFGKRPGTVFGERSLTGIYR